MSAAAGIGGWFAGLGKTLKETFQVAAKKGKTQQSKPLDKTELVATLRKSDLFANLPQENMEALLERMNAVNLTKGDAVIRQGEEGEHYFVLVDGEVTVTRRGESGGGSQVVAELGSGATFGEESLISNAKRNATVTMKAKGTLMRLAKGDFNDHVKEPLITWASPTEAQRKVAEGSQWLDVREEEGTRLTRLRGAKAVPLSKLRDSLSSLEKGKSYVCYCRNGRMSSTATFLLVQHGYDVVVLRGGIQGLERANLV